MFKMREQGKRGDAVVIKRAKIVMQFQYDYRSYRTMMWFYI